MSIKNILVPLLPGEPMERRLDCLLPLARRLEACLDVLLISPDPAESLAFSTAGLMPPIGDLDLLYDDVHRSVDDVAGRLASWRDTNNIPSNLIEGSHRTTFATFAHRMGAPDRILAAAGRLADLIVLDQPKGRMGWIGALSDAAIFDTGRPVLLLPTNGPAPLSRIERIAIAWNGSIEATRAVAGAMPLLHLAKNVVVVASADTTDEPLGEASNRETWGRDLCRALSTHGVHTTPYSIVEQHKEEAGPALLRQIHDLEASLIVMGAYTHSRVKEFLLGGVTRHMFAHSDLPLLVAH